MGSLLLVSHFVSMNNFKQRLSYCIRTGIWPHFQSFASHFQTGYKDEWQLRRRM